MSRYVHHCGKHTGMSGSFSHSEIVITRKEFQEMVKFDQIPVPFSQSIESMLTFYQEQRVIQKVLLLVKTIEIVKQEIH